MKSRFVSVFLHKWLLRTCLDFCGLSRKLTLGLFSLPEFLQGRAGNNVRYTFSVPLFVCCPNTKAYDQILSIICFNSAFHDLYHFQLVFMGKLFSCNLIQTHKSGNLRPEGGLFFIALVR